MYSFALAHCLVLHRRTKSVCGERKGETPDLILLLLTSCVILESHGISQSLNFFISKMEVVGKNKGRIGLSLRFLSAVTN